MADQDAEKETAQGRVNKTALIIGAVMAVVAAAGIYFTFNFVGQEKERDLKAWQIRLGIVSDSRVADVNKWIDRNFTVMRELAENASLQLYMTELTINEEDKPQGADELAQAGYLRNLLVATANRTGFTPPAPVEEVAANVERVGIAGIGLFDATGQPLVSTPGMPPVTGKIRAAAAQALNGEPAIIDIYKGASGLPTMGFALPIFAIQGDDTKGIGVVVGIRTVGNDLFDRLKQPGETEKTAETYLVRKVNSTLEYISPLADGTAPLKRSMALDTQDLAAAFAIGSPGGFAIKQDYAGTEVLVTSRAVAGLPWILVRTVSRKAALSGTETRLRTILIIFVLIIVGVGVAIIAVWRHGSSLRATAALEKANIAAERFENITKFMRLITDSAPAHIVAVDGTTTYTFANKSAADEVGITTDEMLGKTMAGVIGPVKAKVFADINDAILKRFALSDDTEKETESHVLTFGEEDGDEHVEVYKSAHVPLRGDRDFPPAILMIVDDITDLTRERRRSEKMFRRLINTMVGAVDRRDPYSANLSTRTAEVARAIAEEMGAGKEDLQTTEISGHLMNIGRMFIPPEILMSSEDQISPSDRERVANSYMVSAGLLQSVPFEWPVVDTIRQTKEHWDGSGPLGLKEDEILLPARILGVAAEFVSLSAPSAHGDGMTFEAAAAALLLKSGVHYDRKPVSALINYLDNRGGFEKWAHFKDRPGKTDISR